MNIDVPAEVADHVKLALHLFPYAVVGRAALTLGAGLGRMGMRLIGRKMQAAMTKRWGV